MEADPNRSGDGRPPVDPRVAALRHRFRNQIQTMTSLVGLFGRRLPHGDCRTAFEDMRARFEAVAFDPFGDADPTDVAARPVDLGALARQLLSLLDPLFIHRVTIGGGDASASPRRAAALAQILAELLIDLVRNGFDGSPGVAEIAISGAPDGSVRITVSQSAPASQHSTPCDGDLGLQIARGVVRNLGGTLTHEPAGALRTEVFVPGETQ